LVITDSDQVLGLAMKPMFWTKDDWQADARNRTKPIDATSQMPVDSSRMGYQPYRLALN
jgi:hypothetical protein